MADRVCRCGCGEIVKPPNTAFVDREHMGAHYKATGHARATGALGGKASYAPGGKQWARYLERRRQAVQALVPMKDTFTRAEVLRLCVTSENTGYDRGYGARASRDFRGVA